MNNAVQHVLESPKVAAVVGAGTAGIGTGEWFGWIPHDIGKFGVLAGGILSVVLIVSHSYNLYLKIKENQQLKK